MEISYLGHSSFKIRSKGIVVITDPFDPEKVGLPYPGQKADIVVVSHDHFDHNFLQAVKGPVNREEVFVIDQPGEYETGGVEVRSVRTFHDDKQGEKRGNSLISVMRVEEMFVVHLGDLGHELTDKMVEEIGIVDVLLVPVGGEYTIDAEKAGTVVSQLEPRVVIPMHYWTEGMKEDFSVLAGVDEFLKIMGSEGDKKGGKKIKLSKGELPENMQVIVMTT